MARHNKIGEIGEALALKWLKQNGFSIVSKNYRQKWGEIDIIGQKGIRIHFVEVKAVSYETKDALLFAISHETWRPEDNVHAAKLKRLSRTIETWISEKKYLGEWQQDILTVRLVQSEKYAEVKCIPNVIVE